MELTIDKQFLGPASVFLDWLSDESITDILINGTESAFVEREGSLQSVACPFAHRAAFFDCIERLLVPLGRRVDAAKPYIDGRLADGSRFHLILPPLAPTGPLLSIRKRRHCNGAPWESFGPAAVLDGVRARFQNGANILVCGGTGSGKTTFLSRLLDSVSPDERVVVIEETAEILTAHPHCLFLEARAPSPDGAGEVTLRTLIRNALRMRPNRLLLGECRGDEAWEMLQAMNTGHGGSGCTVHANSPLDALRRVETLTLMAAPAPLAAIREWVASAIRCVVHLERKGTARQISAVLEVSGMEGERYRISPTYKA